MQLIFNDDSFDFYDRGKEYRKEIIKELKEERANEIKPKDSKPSLPISSYAGDYSDEMYGDIYLTQTDNGTLELSFSHTPLFKGRLIHWQYDTFKIDWYDIRIPDGFLIFNFNSKREILGFSLDQDNLLDVDFQEIEIKRKKD